MKTKIAASNITLSENQTNKITINVSDDNLTQELLQVFRGLIKQDNALAKTVSIQKNRLDLKTLVLKTKSKKLPKRFSHIQEVVEYLLSQVFEQVLPQRLDHQENTSGHPSPSDADLDDAVSPGKLDDAPIDIVELDPYDYLDDDCGLLGISGECLDFSGTNLRLNYAFEEEEEEYSLGF